uniref:Replication protein A OB domain-containing protein n=1 Tax=Photinus pyralis TaxID=7054 RepID=A0A1Y1KMN4_PHOPY
MDDPVVFTTNEEIDAFQPGDNTIEITAYVDCVEGTKCVGVNKKTLFKFIINNDNGRRIKVLLWEEAAKRYESNISNRQIIHIERALYLPCHPTYYRKENDLLPFEISFTKNTTLIILGTYGTNTSSENEYTFTTIKDCTNVKGTIKLEAYIKVPFEKVTTNYSSFGSGAIVEDIYKLRIHINNFEANPQLLKGTHILVTGEIKKDKYDSIYLHINKMTDIEVMDEKMLSANDLKKGIHTPGKKRLLEETEGESSNANKKLHYERNDSGGMSQLLFNDEDI